ncbi:MAG: FAD-dependent oxidoreductase [Paracoccaceae bacterium]|nr:FAD-dependent oxidoreductase [Paracoccaceae bacterium]MDG1738910.1 FAD-dependent oxidoreductase [Paracoccaceae bacterium]MDG2259290.1 FAD-dependent oxidoreductase [Paracoccaceae bacterium]
MSDVVTVEHNGDIAWVTICNPPVNATSTAVRAGLLEAVSKVATAKYAVIECAGRTFVAGGDMSEFDAPPALPHLPDVYQAIEASEVPFLALMHGNVLGGGFELAMACAWRIADERTKFGLPEVNVGLVSGAGGTQRLPRLIGMEGAVEIACQGKMISADNLAELGGLDKVVGNDLRTAAIEFLSKSPVPPSAVSERFVEPIPNEFLTKKAAELEYSTKGQLSPLHNLAALEWSLEPFEIGQPKERALHLELRQSAESKALRHVFFAQRSIAKPSAIKGASPRAVNHIAIVGGGLMGAGIATACLSGGYQVTIIEQSPDAAERAYERVSSLIDGGVKRGKINAAKRDAQIASLNCVADYSQSTDCDLAIEAVFEDLEVKRLVFKSLAKHMRADAILATNTSYLDPMQIFEGIENQERCVGLHFFSPAHIMKLLEIVKTPHTSPDVLATGFAIGKTLRKVSVLSGICDGFIGNRMLTAYRREADYLLADGAMPHEIDAAVRAFGMPMGPYELQDLTGLQIAWANRKRQTSSRPKDERYISIADQLCEADRLGQKNGKGWHRYEEGDRQPKRDQYVEDLILAFSKANKIERRSFTADEISSRLMAVLANEGARIIQEGIAENAEAVDMVKVNGYGFPKWRGGPMQYASQIGWAESFRIMQNVAKESPNSWVIAASPTNA